MQDQSCVRQWDSQSPEEEVAEEPVGVTLGSALDPQFSEDFDGSQAVREDGREVSRES